MRKIKVTVLALGVAVLLAVTTAVAGFAGGTSNTACATSGAVSSGGGLLGLISPGVIGGSTTCSSAASS